MVLEGIKKSKESKVNYVYGLNTEKRDYMITVSMTSFPERIRIVPKVIESLLHQTLKPDRIVIYLSKDQFPNRRIPKKLRQSKKYGVTIKYVDDDLKPHKKYYYAMQEYPEDVIITVDDDVYYVPKMVERLLKSYLHHPNCISASRVHKIRLDSKGNLLPYNNWDKECFDKIGVESMKLFATGVGGVLYPPHVLPNQTFDKDLIKRTCLMGDDLWLKVMEVSNGIKTVLASNDSKLDFVDGSQNVALWKDNVDGGLNDIQIKNILSSIPNGEMIVKTIQLDTNAELYNCDYYNEFFECPFLKLDINNFNDYLKYIGKMMDNLIVCFAVKDTATTYWNMVDFPKSIKLSKPGYRNAYSCVIDRQRKQFKECLGLRYSNVSYSTDIEINVHSFGYGDNNRTYFEFVKNGKRHILMMDNKNDRGLQVLVFERRSFRVIDFFSVDLHKDPLLLINRP